MEKAGISIVKKSRALFFDPYLRTLGGGERYFFAVAQYFDDCGFDITMASPELPATEQLRTFGLPAEYTMLRLEAENLPAISEGYDCLIYLTNELPEVTHNKQSFLIVQFPFNSLPGRHHVRSRNTAQATLRGYRCVVYSSFVQSWLEKRWRMSSQILNPPIKLGSYAPSAKTKTILAVGRFFPGGHNKRQDALIQAFKQLPVELRNSWKLVLAGGCKDDAQSQEHLEQLRNLAANEPNISFAVNVAQTQLDGLYRQASIFWHGTGYGRGADRPEESEHFGMTTIEAMSYGCVPLVYGDGGQLEIVKPAFGHFWSNPSELAELTRTLMAHGLSKKPAAAVEASKQYSYEAFRKQCERVFV